MSNDNRKKNITRNIALLGILLSLALILGYVEMLMLPDIMIPGVKVGLSNLCIILSLYNLGNKNTFILGILKVTISAVLFSGITTLIYGLLGSILSILVMIFLMNLNKFSIGAVSAVGAVFHNVGQLVAAIIMVGTIDLLYYLPVLMIAGLICGLIIGIPAGIINKTINNLKG